MANNFTPEEDAYIRDHIKEQSYKQLAENLSHIFKTRRTEKTVNQHCCRCLHIQRGRNFTPEEDAYLRENIQKQTQRELAENLTKKFGVLRTEQAVRDRCNRWLKIHRDAHYYTVEQMDFVRENAPNMSIIELADAYNSKFEWHRTPHALADLSKKLKVYRTKEAIDRIYAETGKTREAQDGEINIKEGRARIKFDGHWRLRSRVVWEEYYGKIPSKHVILHLDGNGINDDIDNLICVPRRYCGLVARAFNGFGENIDLNKTKLKYCELKDALSGRSKE